MKKIIEKLTRFRKYMDVTIAASALAQAGELELAREMMLQAEEQKTCCGALDDGRNCNRIWETRCELALQQ